MMLNPNARRRYEANFEPVSGPFEPVSRASAQFSTENENSRAETPAENAPGVSEFAVSDVASGPNAALSPGYIEA